MTFRIGVVGLGWSGSGAVIDLLKKKADAAGCPIECDFFRKPSGLLECSSTVAVRVFCLRQMYLAIARLLKSLVRLVISPRQYSHFFTSLMTSASDILCSLIILICSLVIRDSNVLINRYVDLTVRLYRKGASAFYFDQPLFPEQLHQKSVDSLKLDALVIVTRDVRDQVIEWQENGKYLKAKTIREQFFVGAQIGETNALSKTQISAMLQTLDHRIEILEGLTKGSPIAIHYLRFEDLILRPQDAVNALNSYFSSRGSIDSLIQPIDLEEFFSESQKNIGKYRATAQFDSVTINALQNTNERLNILTRGKE